MSGALLGILPAVLAFVLFPGPATAAGATEHLRTKVARVLEVLHDPTVERRVALTKIMSETFDFEEMVRGPWGGTGQCGPRPNGALFIGLLAGLLERAYLSKVDLHADAEILFTAERQETDDALVRTRIVPTHGAELPVDYYMHRRGADWLIYGVVIDGVSVVDHYRAQFNEVIESSSYSELVAKMQALEGGQAAPGAGSR